LILCLGAAGVFFGLLPRFRYTGLVAVASALGALAALLLLSLQLPSQAVLSAWAPAALFAVGLELEADALGWLFGLALLVVVLTALLTGLARPGGSRVGTRATMLLLTVASLISIFSANLVTRVLAWALLDLIYFVALVFLSDDEGIESQAVLNLAFNSAGTLLAVAAAVLISRTSESLSLRDAALTAQSTLLITLAAVFRLGLFPLHLGLPTTINIRQGLSALLRLAPALVALETISRLANFGIPAAVGPWLTVLACAAALVGAFQLWSAADPRQGIAYLVISQSGVALLAGLWGGAQASLTLMAVSISLVLGAALIYLGNGFDETQRWPTLLPLVGVAAMAGAPLTLGFLGVGQLYANLAASGGWGWLILVALLLAQTLLIAGLLYTVLWPGNPLEAQPLLAAVFYTGLSLPAVMLILIAFFAGVIATSLASPGLGLLGFSGPGSLVGVGAVALSVGGAIALWRFDAPLRDRFGGVGGASVAALARLDWLYRWIWTAVRSAGSAVENLAGVLEGEGAILWTMVAGILIWLLWKG
jgi:formate hydrogenlyase subunit 3/multisubunit Na+/H+ antiporter MnhD subunit